MTLTQDLQVTPTHSVKFEITGYILPDGTYQGETLYKLDSDIENKYWLGANPQVDSEIEKSRVLINEKGDILQVDLHKGFIDSNVALFFV